MNKIKAVLVDDEPNARENLKYLLEAFCEQVKICGEAGNVDEAVELIHKEQPKLVFLDIEMPQKNGFHLFNEFDAIDFQVIFVTAYDSYAIKAFQVAAIDYLMKPIEVALLKTAVQKAQNAIDNVEANERLQVLLDNKKQITKIAIPYKNDYAIVKIDEILCIEADRMYSVIHLVGNKQYMVAKKLSHYENLFHHEDFFIRVHRSWMLNTNYIDFYSKKEHLVKLNNQKTIPVSKTYKENFESIFES